MMRNCYNKKPKTSIKSSDNRLNFFYLQKSKLRLIGFFPHIFFKKPIFYPYCALLEVKPVFSPFSFDSSLVEVVCDALNLQLSFVFLTSLFNLIEKIDVLSFKLLL